LSLLATKLLEIFGEVASEKLAATLWMREARMSQGLAVRSQSLLFGARESGDAVCFLLLWADFSVFGDFFRSGAGSFGLVKDQAGCAWKLVGYTVDALVKLVALVFIQMVEKSVGSVAPLVNSSLRLLNVFPFAALDVEWVIALGFDGRSVVKHKAVRTQGRRGNTVNTLVVQITLFRIREKSVWFRTFERWQV